MKASKGFEVHIDGKRVKFSAGSDVPEDICTDYGLLAKGLVVKPASGVEADALAGASKSAKRKK